MRKAVFSSGEDHVDLPESAFDFPSFRRWLHSGRFPEEGRISYINGAIMVDLSMEEFFDHGQVKFEIARVLGNLLKETRFGRFAPDGTRYSHLKTRLTTEPDGMIISHEAFDSGRVVLKSGKKGKDTEVVGTPDIVIEVVSPSSEGKDTEYLMSAYYKAGIPEYWITDVRDSVVRFEIFQSGKKGYRPVRVQDGWVASPILGRAFRLVESADESGSPEYTLEVR